MHTNQPAELDLEQTASGTDNEEIYPAVATSEELQQDQSALPPGGSNGDATPADDETDALTAPWASNHEGVTTELSPDAVPIAITEDAPVDAAAEPAATKSVTEAPESEPIPTDEVVDAPVSIHIEIESALADLVLEPAKEQQAGFEAVLTEEVTESVTEITAAERVAEADAVQAVEPADPVSEATLAESVAEADATEESVTAAAQGAAVDEPAHAPIDVAKVEPKQIHDEASDQKLIAEVEAAPHKVYLLNRVRKAAGAAGESEQAVPLKAAEEQILAEIASRTAAKEALCERAEAIKDSTAWKVTGDAFKALFDEWKQVGAAGRELDDQLWARFNLARGAFNERRSKHFEEREVVWSANRELKEALCVEAEALADSTAWKATADAIRDLQAKWKAIGSAGREKDEALWARFNTAKQKFFDNRTVAWEENRKRKEALVIDAETLKDSVDWRSAGDAMKAMQTEWKNVGPAGREHEDELWSRFRAATQEFFDRRSSVFAERNQAERDNAAQKTELCVRAESLVYTGEPLSAAREAKDLQAQWKEIGPVPREQSEPLWARFREACDKIFANASGERDRQQNEWHVRMREAMTRKREQLTSLRESIAHDEANILRWRESLSTMKPGGKSEEIGKSLEDKIIDVMGRIREKQERAEDLKSSITDIEAKLKE